MLALLAKPKSRSWAWRPGLLQPPAPPRGLWGVPPRPPAFRRFATLWLTPEGSGSRACPAAPDGLPVLSFRPKTQNVFFVPDAEKGDSLRALVPVTGDSGRHTFNQRLLPGSAQAFFIRGMTHPPDPLRPFRLVVFCWRKIPGPAGRLMPTSLCSSAEGVIL